MTSPTSPSPPNGSGGPIKGSSLAKLVDGLIPSPTSLQEHKKNLVKCLLHPELVIELEYRKAFPDISHEQYVALRNDPDLLQEVRDEFRASEGIPTYIAQLRTHGRLGKEGDLASARWFSGELGLSEERRQAIEAMKDGSLAYQKLIQDVSKGVGDVLDAQKKKPKIIEAQAEVK